MHHQMCKRFRLAFDFLAVYVTFSLHYLLVRYAAPISMFQVDGAALMFHSPSGSSRFRDACLRVCNSITQSSACEADLGFARIVDHLRGYRLNWRPASSHTHVRWVLSVSRAPRHGRLGPLGVRTTMASSHITKHTGILVQPKSFKNPCGPLGTMTSVRDHTCPHCMLL